jgi:RNA polymerase sigma-70 factor, ECF subfamily
MRSIRASGDAREDFAKAFEEYADAIFRHCYTRVRDRETAKDLTQNTFIRTWEYIAKGNDIENIRAFLYKTAGNLTINEINQRKRRGVTSLEELQESGRDIAAESEPEALEMLHEERHLLQKLYRVPSPYREAVIMRYVDGLKPAEIAEITGETANVVSVRIHRGIQYLRSFLNPPL